MATYNTLQIGSTGADVKKLQQTLIDKGYDLGKSGADGIYGDITKAAVEKYQADNNLKVDGLAGNITQSSLYTVPNTQTPPTTNNNTNVSTGTGTSISTSTGVAPAQDTSAAYDPAVDAAYQSALSALLQVQQNVPVYKDSFSSQLQDVYDKIVNREKFSFDVNADPMYQQLKDEYIAQGKLAMADTMGQAAAMNGGYGSSYAQSVGQQAYQGYMQQLNDAIPEAYDRALDRYNQEGQDLLNQYAMLGDMADDEYAKYQDSLNKYYTDLDIARSEADKAYNRGYQASRDEVSDKQWQETFEYGKERDKVSDEQWQKQYAETIKQNEINNAQWEQSFGYQQEQDKIANDRYDEQTTYERGQVEKDEAYDKVMSFIGTDYTPSDSELSAAGLTRAQYDAISKYATTPGSTTTPESTATPENILWTYTGAVDSNYNLIYENNLGERKTFGRGVNPYTGGTNSDTKYGTFSNGYQPDNIGGTKLKNSGMTTKEEVTGKAQTIWEANGKYWLWRGDLNRYIEVDISEVTERSDTKTTTGPVSMEYLTSGFGRLPKG